jgi:putative tricarboxylic transport membrane protein
MDFFTVGLPTALQLTNIVYCFAGVTLGTFIGVLPGIGPLAAVSLLLPVTIYLNPTTALVMLAGIYYGAEYGGSITSILLNMPGTPGNAITVLDGHPLAKQGKAGTALFTAAFSSFCGGSLGILALMLIAPAIVRVALSFGAAEYFAAILLALIAASTVSGGSPLKGLAMLIGGMLIGTIGTDHYTGVARYSWGQLDLIDGVTLPLVALGLFGVGEVALSAGIKVRRKVTAVSLWSMLPTRSELRRAFLPILRGAGYGSIFGALPGVGPAVATVVSYATEKKVSATPEKFGTGMIEGVAAPEASNNAAVQTAFIPTLSLGIPGSPTTAVLLGALIMNGIIPGPRLVTEQPELFWGLIASFWVGNVLLLVLNVPLISVWVSVLRIPYSLLYPGIISLVCVGVYSIHSSSFEVLMVMGFGVAGYAMRLLNLQLAPFLLGFILGPMLEQNLRRALLLAGGDFINVVTRPIAGSLLACILLIAVWVFYASYRARRREGT